jgi:O-antigen/teichoic acid export membrane protein
MSAEEAGLSKRVASSAAWRILKVGVDNVLRFVTFAVFARVLTPADFGIFAIATLFTGIAFIITSAGLPDALKKDRNPDEELKNTLFWANLALCIALSIVLAAISPLAAIWAGDRRVIPVLCVLALTMLIQPLSFINATMADREFKQRLTTTLGVIASVTSSVIAIVAVLLGFGLWSLVLQTASYSLLNALLIRWKVPWNPTLTFSKSRLRSVSGFSVNLLGAQLQQLLIVRMQELIATSFLSISAVGYYRVGSRFMELIAQAVITPVSGLSMVAFSKISHDRERLAKAYLRMLSTTAMFYCPVMLGFSAVADDAVPLLFGDKWAPSIAVVQILGLLSPATILAYYHSPVLASVGRSDILRRIVTMQLVGTVVFSLIGVQFGLVGLAGSFVLRSYVTLPVQMRWLRNATGVQSERGLLAVMKPFVSALVMSAAVYGAQLYMRTVIDHAAVRLVISCALGAMLYPAIMGLLFRETLNAHVADVRLILKRAT